MSPVLPTGLIWRVSVRSSAPKDGGGAWDTGPCVGHQPQERVLLLRCPGRPDGTAALPEVGLQPSPRPLHVAFLLTITGTGMATGTAPPSVYCPCLSPPEWGVNHPRSVWESPKSLWVGGDPPTRPSRVSSGAGFWSRFFFGAKGAEGIFPCTPPTASSLPLGSLT